MVEHPQTPVGAHAGLVGCDGGTSKQPLLDERHRGLERHGTTSPARRDSGSDWDRADDGRRDGAWPPTRQSDRLEKPRMECTRLVGCHVFTTYAIFVWNFPLILIGAR